MQYENIRPAIFRSRPNRFIAMIELDGEVHACHVKNTGRCKELLIEGVRIYVQEHDNPSRKTRFSLIAVMKGDRLINMDSQIPNAVVQQYVASGHLLDDVQSIRREYTYGQSRIDLLVQNGERPTLIEVKGVTLEKDGLAMFPDAPTQRGIKHIRELIQATKDGYDCYIIFVIQMAGIQQFAPNMDTHPAFGHTLREAAEQGVHIRAYNCHITPASIDIAESCAIIYPQP